MCGTETQPILIRVIAALASLGRQTSHSFKTAVCAPDHTMYYLIKISFLDFKKFSLLQKISFFKLKKASRNHKKFSIRDNSWGKPK